MTSQKDFDLSIDDLVLPEWAGTNAKGRETRELILRSALQILVEEGYSAMSMRRVATKAGMKFGNLTYHYPSRDELVTELLDSAIKAYEVAFVDRNANKSLSAEERMGLFISLGFASMQYKNQACFAPEIWALSNHEPFASARMHEMYERARHLIEDIIVEMRPDLSEDHVRAVALFFSASIEGFVMFIGAEKPFQQWRPAMEKLATKFMIDMVKTIKPDDIGDLAKVDIITRSREAA